MASKIQIRRDSAADWTSANPTLAVGEMGYETDTGKLKFGDGTTAWNSLGYFNDTSHKVIIKSTDETVASSETLQDDDELKFSLLSGESWGFEITFMASEAASNPNIKFRLAAADGLTGSIEYTWVKFGTTANSNISDFTTDSGAIALDTTKSGILVMGAVKATANGTLQLQWAQATSDIDVTTVHALSKLTAHKS